MGLFERVADNSNPGSLASVLRRRRVQVFQRLIARVPRPVQILDVGGTLEFWGQTDIGLSHGLRIVVLNTDVDSVASPRLASVTGDARSMPQFDENEFDVVFSNSVIEHVGGWVDQQQMAAEVLRVGRRYFVQTPNKHFPIEPHYVFPAFQFLPEPMQVELLRRFELGHVGRIADRDDARRHVRSIRLLTAGDVRRLFPTSQLYRERLLGVTKSFVAYGGWSA